MLFLWTSLDVRSRGIAVSEKLDEKEYKDLHEHIDRRYKIHFGHMEYRSNSKDDPMGLALVGDSNFEAPKMTSGPDGQARSSSRPRAPSSTPWEVKAAKAKATANATSVVETDMSFEIVSLCSPLVRRLQNAMVAMAAGICAMITRLFTQS